MEASHAGTSGSGTVPEGETGVGETVEIKIKTPDSQSYTLRVEKNVAVPALKERLVSVVGVPVERQRLICHGKLLEDDQLLSAYNVEDGHTLHLVARQPPSTSTDGSSDGSSDVSSDDGVGETDGPPSGGRHAHVAYILVTSTLNDGESVLDHLANLNRITNAITMRSLGSHGAGRLDGGTGNADNPNGGVPRPPGGLDGGASDGRNGGSSPNTSSDDMEVDNDVLSGRPQNSTGNTGQSAIRGVQAPVVIPNALTTMSQYLDTLEQLFVGEEVARTRNSQGCGNSEVRVVNDALEDQPRQERSPVALGAIVNRVNNLLHGDVRAVLSHLASGLQSEPTMLEEASREDLEHGACRVGRLMRNMGAFLLELARAMVGVRIGRSPSAALVNSAPAVFISSSGPNPLIIPLNLEPQQPPAAESVERPAEGEVRATENALSSRDAFEGHSVERALALGVASKAVDEMSGDPERSELSPEPTPQGETSEAGGGDGPSREIGDASATTSVGLRLGGLQPVPAGLRKRRQSQRSSQEGQETSQSLRAPGDVANDISSRGGMPPSGHRVRAIGRGDRLQGGPSIIGQLMRSPMVNNLEHQVMEGAGDVDGATGARRGAAGDGSSLSGMLPQVVPAVTQMLNGGSSGAFPGSTGGTSAMTSGDGPVRASASPGAGAERGEDALAPHPLIPPGRRIKRVTVFKSYFRPKQPPEAETVERPSEGEPRATEDEQSRRDALDGHSVERALDLGVTSMVVDELKRRLQSAAAGDGLNLSGMPPQVVPAVTQMLNGGSSGAFPGSTGGTSAMTSGDGPVRASPSQGAGEERWEDAPAPEEVASWSETIAADKERHLSMPRQPPLSDVYCRGSLAAETQKTVETAVESVTEKLKDGGSEEIVPLDLSPEISGNIGSTNTSAPRMVGVDGLPETQILETAHGSGIQPQSSSNSRETASGDGE